MRAIARQSHRRARRFHLVALTAILAAALTAVLAPAGASAAGAPAKLWRSCPSGIAAGQCDMPRGVAVDPNLPGHLYVADQSNLRVNEFTAWGIFVKSWGWDVVASGPGDDTDAPEDQFEICVPENGDSCKAGTQGAGAGQFGSPQGVALDSDGNVYVIDHSVVSNHRVTHRVQKFSPAGQFVLTFGGQVNRTKVEAAAPESEQNLCTAASGDVCQGGSAGAGNGQFGAWPFASFIAVGPGDTVYVGDEERVQEFEANGTYLKSLPLPGETVHSLAVDPGGDLYVTGVDTSTIDNGGKKDVLKLSPAGVPLCTATVGSNTTALATDGAGNLYVVAIPVFQSAGVIEFDAACKRREVPAFGEDELTGSTGIAAGSPCLTAGADVYVANSLFGPSFVSAYGPPPDKQVPACLPPEVPPSIGVEYAVSVDATGAVVRAQINPHFWADTTYHVQYGTAACIEAGWEAPCAGTQPLPPGSQLGGGVFDAERVTAGVFLTGLEPETEYRYRFVAQSSGGGPVVGEGAGFTTFPLPRPPKSDCPNQAFRTDASARLPGCRAYEMVSPVDKANGDITVTTFGNAAPRLDQSSVSGDELTYSAAQAFGDAVGAPTSSQYIATRQPGQAWSSHNITPPQEGRAIVLTLDLEFKAFSPDLSSAWLRHDTEPSLAPGAVAGYAEFYRRDNSSGSYEALIAARPPSRPPGEYFPELQGLSADGADAFFTTGDGLPVDDGPGPAPCCKRQLYGSSGGELRLVSVLPDGAACPEEASVGRPGLEPGGPGRGGVVATAVSADASRVYFACGEELALNGRSSKLYLRQNPQQPQSASGKCDEPETACTAAVSTGSGVFWAASADGSTAFFTTTGASSTYPGALIEFDAATETRTPIATGVVGVMGASRDATRLYFASTNVLTGGEENSAGDKAQAGQPNLYLYERGGGMHFVATLSPAEVNSTADAAPLAAQPAFRRSRISSDGLHVAFMSWRSLTGYDNSDAESGEADAEVFIYDAAAGRLVCVSCNPSGARPAGRLVKLNGEALHFWIASQIQGWATQLYAPRNLSGDGRRLFFESYDALVPRDTNGMQDVYEWTSADGRADCEALGADLFVASSGGCLSLISSGKSAADSEFRDASPDGRDVFITTEASLVPQDPGLIDVYDAREGGGLPPPPAARAGCEGSSCQSPAAAPNDPTPASAAFRGPGSAKPVKPRRCRRGARLVRRAGKARCVKRHRNERRRRHHRHHRRAAR